MWLLLYFSAIISLIIITLSIRLTFIMCVYLHFAVLYNLIIAQLSIFSVDTGFFFIVYVLKIIMLFVTFKVSDKIKCRSNVSTRLLNFPQHNLKWTSADGIEVYHKWIFVKRFMLRYSGSQHDKKLLVIIYFLFGTNTCNTC